MTEQISAEICRICGIAPIELTGCSFVNLREYGIEEGTDVCEAVEDETITCDKCKYSKKASELFPDFGQAENFLKLYNMEVRGTPVCYVVHSNYETTSSKMFLKNLLTVLNGKAPFCKELQNEIKNGRWLI